VEIAVAMSGGVDSSVAAAMLVEAGHAVTGVTAKLWGGPADAGCCSASDVDDARRVCDHLGIAHHVVNLSEAFEAEVVDHYVDAHRQGRTPNPCIECNRRIKFDLLLDRCRRLGFAKLATGHHARIRRGARGAELRRGADPLKDQSYVLSMLGESTLDLLELPVGELDKSAVRALAVALGLRTADKPDSQDVCFISTDAGRAGFLATRLDLHPAEVVEASSGEVLGTLPAVELVTLGQRRGFGAGPDGERRYVVAVDVPARRVEVAPLERATSDRLDLERSTLTATGELLRDGQVLFAQVSAHGQAMPARFVDREGILAVVLETPARLVAPGQTVAFYDAADPDLVLGSAVVA